MRPSILAAAAAVLLLAGPAPAAADSLVLQPAAAATGPGGTVEVAVLARLAPDGKAVVPVRAADLVLTAKGGGTVAPASESPGETKWIYRAPESVAADLAVVLEARVRAYPDAAGSCALEVKAPAAPKPPAAAGDDGDGDEVEGAEGAAADPVGKLVTLEKWRARAGEGEEWNERKIPERGEILYAPGLQHDFRFRVTAADAASVEVQWWRNDRPKKVRAFTERNRRLDLDRDQDGLLHLHFVKAFEKEKSEYTFALVVRMKDGRVARENIVVVRARPPKEDGEGGGEGKRRGGGKGK